MRLVPALIAAVVTLAAFLRIGPRPGFLVALVAFGAVTSLVRALERRRITLAQSHARRSLFGVLSAAGGEKALLEKLQKTLESPEPSDVLYAVDLLEKLGQPPDAERRKALLAHPSAEVRRATVEGASDIPCLRDAVRQILEHDPSPDVRAAAARELGAAGEIADLDTLAPLLNPRFPAVREGALAGLLASRSVEAQTLGVAELERLQASTGRDDRCAAAKLLGRVSDPRFLAQLETLLGDRDPMVRKCALESAGRYPKATTRLAPLLLKGLSETRTAASAGSALIAHGEPVVAQLRALYESETSDESTKRRVLSIAGRIGGHSSEELLWDIVEGGPIDHRRLALSWLVTSSARTNSKSRALLRDGVERELDAALWVLAAKRDIESDEPENSLLIASLGREIELLRERLRYGLNLLGLELDEVALERELEALFGLEVATGLPALLSSPSPSAIPAEALNALRSVYPHRMMSRDERLKAVVARTQWLAGWTRATALYRLAELGSPNPELTAIVAESLEDPSPLVRETAVWAASRLKDAKLSERVAKACEDEAELVSRIARHVREPGATARPSGP